MVQHYEFRLPPYPRGFHLITRPVLQQLPVLPSNGLFQLFILHTSAALTLNENADPSVRVDFASTFDRLVPENAPHYTHTLEGPDDMPAHIKSALLGQSVSIPIVDRQFRLGTWQGIYLCEFRNHASGRKFVASILT